jgi:hypothetical protein
MAFHIVSDYFSLILSRLAVQIRPYVNGGRLSHLLSYASWRNDLRLTKVERW